MVKALMDWETIDRDQIRDIMEGREPQPPKVYIPENPVAAFEPPKMVHSHHHHYQQWANG